MRRFGLFHPKPSERGATLVEFSLIMPLITLVMVGTVEIGGAFKDYLEVSAAVREASRVGAFMGDDPQADCEVVKQIVVSLNGDVSRVDQIEVFVAHPNGKPNLMKTNKYQYKGSGDPLDCKNWTHLSGPGSTGRKVKAGNGISPDILGVRLVVDRAWYTGLPPFRGNYKLDESTVIRIEPESYA